MLMVDEVHFTYTPNTWFVLSA